MIKKITYLTLTISLLALTGFSCQSQPSALNLPAPKILTQKAVYYLPVNQQSTGYKSVLVPAGSKVVGCNDYLTLRQGVQISAPDQAGLLKAALEEEFTVTPPKDDFYYNPLAENAKIAVDSVEQNGDLMIIRLSGQFNSPGECADPVMKGMIQETIKEYTQHYQIFLNGNEANWRCLFDLSGQCQ